MFKEKYALGKELRGKVLRADHASWKEPANRPSVEKMIELSDYDRIPDLIPIRHYRMTKSPLVFYRATASLMAADLSVTNSTGINIQTCGDCHLMNFGCFATPERSIVADINDFDETNPGPWEWDLKRLATSFVLAARAKKMSEQDSRDIAMKLVAAYQDKMNEYSRMNFLELWYTRFTMEDLQKLSGRKKVREEISEMMKKAEDHSHEEILYKIASSTKAGYLIEENPPLIYHAFHMEESREMINLFMENYKKSLQPDRKLLLDQYRVMDIAMKVVGVGSVGTRCFVVLMMNDHDEPVFVQVKEARQSVLEKYTQPSLYGHPGERIVQGQRIMQATSDIFLGWSMGLENRDYYVRLLRDKKISFDVDNYGKYFLSLYASLCGSILARAHSKSLKGPLICGYIGKGDQFEKAICRFAAAYADQTEKDYEDFMKAVKRGRLEVKEG